MDEERKVPSSLVEAMSEFAAERIIDTYKQLPGGSSMEEYEFKRLKERCKDILCEAQTVDEIKSSIDRMVRKFEDLNQNEIETLYKSSSELRRQVRLLSERSFEELREEIGHVYTTRILEPIEKIQQIENEFVNKYGDLYEANSLDIDDHRSPFTVAGEPVQISQTEGKSSFDLGDEESPFTTVEEPVQTSQAEVKSPFDWDDDKSPFVDVEEPIQTSQADYSYKEAEPKIIEKDGKSYAVTKEAVYNEQNQLIEPGEIRTIGATKEESMKQGHVVIKNGTYNMILTLEEYAEVVIAKNKEKTTQHQKDSEINM